MHIPVKSHLIMSGYPSFSLGSGSGGNDAQFDRNCFSSSSPTRRPWENWVERRWREVCHRCDQEEREERGKEEEEGEWRGGRKAIETITAKEKYREGEREREGKRERGRPSSSSFLLFLERFQVEKTSSSSSFCSPREPCPVHGRARIAFS